MHIHRRIRPAILLALALALALSAACSSADAPATDEGATGYQPTPFATAEPVTPVLPGEVVASTASLPLERLPVAEFVPASGGGGPRLPIEVLPQGEFTIGLSGRHTLGERGMLFDYGAPGQGGAFWMKNTHIDLDIAFLDESLRIVSIRTMRAESLDYIYSSAPYQAAIEAPGGWYAAHGVREGDRVRYLPPTVPPTP